MAVIDNRKSNVKLWNKWDMGLLAVCLGFYLFFPFYDGPVWCADSLSYATMNITREPLYPTFLWVFRSIFGEENYLFPVVIVQGLLAAYASFHLAMTVKKYCGGSKILAAAAVSFQFCVTLLCRFVAIRGSSYINSIMTEALGLSFFVLFVVQLYRYLMEEKMRNLVGTAVFSLMLINLRKQMMITLCLMAAVFVLYYLIKSRKIKRLILLLCLTAAILFVSKGTDRLYNYLVRGAFVEHSGNSMGMLCTLIYTANPEDAGRFGGEPLVSMYEEIYAQSREQGLNIEFAPEDWVGLSSHYADSYDAIGYGIINPVVQTYIAKEFEYSEVEAAQAYDRYCAEMVRVLLQQEKGDLLRVYASNTWKGLINSIARVHPLLNIGAVLAYLLYLGLYLLLVVKKKSFCKVQPAESFGEMVLGAVLINSMVVGAMIFCQPRYMIYSMGLFYLAIAMLLYELISVCKKTDKGGGSHVGESS